MILFYFHFFMSLFTYFSIDNLICWLVIIPLQSTCSSKTITSYLLLWNRNASKYRLQKSREIFCTFQPFYTLLLGFDIKFIEIIRTLLHMDFTQCNKQLKWNQCTLQWVMNPHKSLTQPSLIPLLCLNLIEKYSWP